MEPFIYISNDSYLMEKKVFIINMTDKRSCDTLNKCGFDFKIEFQILGMC